MNKKINTVLFMLAATVGTTLTALVLIIIPVIILVAIMGEKFAEVTNVILPILFIASMIGTFLIYSLVMKRINEKVDMEKYFDPMVAKKKKPL